MKTSRFLGFASLLFASVLAHAELVATNVSNAENTLQTSNQRLFASSQGAFYEITLGSSGWSKTPLPVRFRDGSARSCYFLGITESAGMVYTACTEDSLNPLAKKHLFGLDIFQPAPQLTEVGELHGMALPNGLAADASGNLYAADSGWPLLPGTIQKITLASAYTIASQTTFHRFIACKPNGLRYAGGKLYVTVNPFSYVGVSQLLRYDLGAGGLSNQASLYSSLAFLDDFALVNGGAVLAEFLGGRIVHINEQGNELHRAGFSQPTSVSLLTAPAFGSGSLLVTERGAGNVQHFANDWGLQPRQ
ncbi:hypothetical protein [Herbaspirillum sp. ST 5-3]|uniref:hypothetical protein n=1 Tax=Oxalobacteraceae TaxID=75682 RepID=UPI0010A5986D|nr:hypothetical protein [Herbaspirillum sp. ST 5-3]